MPSTWEAPGRTGRVGCGSGHKELTVLEGTGVMKEHSFTEGGGEEHYNLLDKTGSYDSILVKANEWKV